MAFPPQFLDDIRSRVPLSVVASRRVRLQRRGRGHTGLCPFHNEKTPSFTINEEKGFFHCFGCGAHGDVISFEMRALGLSFVDAVERLAGEAGMEIPQSSPEERDRARNEASLYDVMEAAAVLFEKQLRLPAGQEGLNYLRRRGLEDDILNRFRLGYAPPGNALKAALGRENISEEMLVVAGLVGRPENGRTPYDIFRDRVMFPITDRRGRVIAFGGRVLGDAQPKYLNSPDTPLFQKGRVLYGLAQARSSALEKGSIVVTEGYMDVIAMNRAGFAHSVAPLGTALTEGQITELWRLAPEPTLCFDGDAAGRRAAKRAATRALPLLKPGLSLRFASLPESKDPDDLLRTEGAGAMTAVLEAAESLSEMTWRILIEDRNTDTPERRAALERDIDQLTERIEDGTVRQHYRRALRQRAWERFAPKRKPYKPGSRAGSKSGKWRPDEITPTGALTGAPPTPRVGDTAHQTFAAFLLMQPSILLTYFDEAATGLRGAEALSHLIEDAVMILSGQPDSQSDALLAALEQGGHGNTLALIHERLTALQRKPNPDPEAEFKRMNALLHDMALAREMEGMVATMGGDQSPDLWRRYQALQLERCLLREEGD